PSCSESVSFFISLIALTRIKPSTKKDTARTPTFSQILPDSEGLRNTCHPSLNVSYAKIVITTTATIQNILITLPKPVGNRSDGGVSASTLPINTNPWLTESASECMD